VLGTPIANRTVRAAEGVVGCLINTLALRLDLAGNPSFRTLLARVRTVALDAYTHQELPFEALVEDLQPPRIASHHPFFDVLFAVQNTPLPATRSWSRSRWRRAAPSST
jgi:non-ribosomal peptide synthetase component F